MTRILRALLHLLPERFLARFGEELAGQIEMEAAQARARGSRWVIWFAVSTAVDLAVAAVTERWSPTWVETRAYDDRRVGDGMMKRWARDLRLAVRSLRRTPAFTATSVGMLGVAIGANAAIFSVIDAVLLDPLPFEDADRLVYIAGIAPGTELSEEFFPSMEFFFDYREQTDVLRSLATYNAYTGSFRVGDRVERVRISMPSLSLFETLGVEPSLGRLPLEEEGQNAAVISHAAWVDWFGGDPGVIGGAYEIDGGMRTVVGVMRPDFGFPSDDVLAWVPSDARPVNITPGRFGGAALVGRLAEGVDEAALAERLTAVAQRLPERWGGSAGYARVMQQHRAVVRPLGDELVGDARGPLMVLFGAVALVLLIACANVTNLLLVRAESRRKDIAVRRAIGAGRSALVRSQMAESLILALGAGSVALPLARLGLPAIAAAAPDGVPGLGGAAVSVTTLAFTVVLCLFVSAACGLGPALRATRPSTGGLLDGSRGSTARRHWARDGLVVGQTALALVLLVGSGLLVRSFRALRSVDPGYSTEDILTFQFAPGSSSGLESPEAWARFHLEFLERMRLLPGVKSVGIVENVPLNEGVRETQYRRAGAPEGDDSGPLIGRTWTAGDYFGTMGIEVLRGRTFAEADHLTDLGNIIVSAAAADLLWPGEEPLRQQLQWPGREEWYTVVGVVEDVMQYSFRDDVQPLIYFSLVSPTPDFWAMTSPAYVVNSERPESLVPDARALVRELAPSAPMYRIFTMEQLAADSMLTLSFTMLTLGVASVLALLLGAVGLYGVLSYVVAERTREIGVRMALGARAVAVRRMVVVQGGRVVLLGVVVGALVATAATRALSSLLFGVEALDFATFSTVSVGMLLVGIVASYLPARRASAVDPIESLRGG